MAARRLAVDIGFIVYNTLNYPNFSGAVRAARRRDQALGHGFLGFARRRALRMGGRETAVVDGLFAQRSNIALARPYPAMLLEILRFQKTAKADLAADAFGALTLGRMARRARLLASGFATAISCRWARRSGRCRREHAGLPGRRPSSRFCDNHKLLQWQRPTWRTVDGRQPRLCRGAAGQVPRQAAARRSGDAGRALGCRAS